MKKALKIVFNSITSSIYWFII